MPMVSKSSNSGNFVTSRRAIFALAVLASTAWTPAARATEFPAVIPLSSLDGSIGFRLDGVGRRDISGRSVASAGDVNGDGYADVIVGARYDRGGSGSSYVVFGKASGFAASIDLSSLNGSNGFRLDGVAAGDISGVSVASAGDVNGDGFADVIVGASDADPHGSRSGSSYVVFGKASGFAASIKLSLLNGRNGFRLDGVADYDSSGRSVASAGDVNGDGFADVIVRATSADPHGSNSGSSYVVFGKASGFAASIALSSLDGTTGFRLDGAAAGDYSGYSVASAGDVNGDGFADLIIGADGADPHGAYSGSSYVVFGKASGFAASIALSSLNGATGFRLDGVAAGDSSGRSVASAGDVNGDGFADLIVGASRADAHGVVSGSSYVVFGKASVFAPMINLSVLNGSNGLRLDGVAAGDFSGYSVASAGDVNGDGFADVIVGASRADPHGSYSGSSYVVFGKASGFAASIDLSSLDGTNGFRLDGVAAGDRSGLPVAGAGDVNGDGFADLIVGADGADPHGSESGSSYVVFGRAPDTARIRVGAAANQYISGGAFGDTLKGLGGTDALEGRGGADGLFGGTGNDTASYLHSAGVVSANLATPASNTGDAAGDSYTSIGNLIGSRFADTLTGNSLANRLTGAPGTDVLTGSGGGDIFAYTRLDDSPAGAGRDNIADFNAGDAGTSVDRIDLSAIDAKTGPGNQAFTFAPFNGTKGRLRARLSGTTTIVEGDVNGDNIADFEIGLLNFTNLANLTSIDFIR
jgi:hypothetical protein